MTTEATLHRIALVGTHTPRRCGIATFTADLADALSASLPRADVQVLALNDVGHRYEYPARVVLEITDADPASYARAARVLEESGADCVSLQHEYGIFGGPAGSHVLALLRVLRIPVVTTLHTILPAPTAAQRTVMDELTRRSARLVVMSHGGAALLRGVHGVDPTKIDVIAHGIPPAPLPDGTKHELGLAGRSVILTYGLLSPDKGIERVIEAMPGILARDRSATYVVLGTTHPRERETNGERYRDSLVARARALGVDGSVLFRDRYATPAELASYLGAADVYVTPYLQPDQMSSGTLAYAVGAGKAVVSTPYRYAREMLAEGRGVLVASQEPRALVDAIAGLLADAPRRAKMGALGRTLGATMHWPVVAGRYAASFVRAIESAPRGPAPVARTAGPGVELPPLVLDHLRAMTDSTGVLQHATYDVPCYDDGYCLDDNARALLLTTWLDPEREPRSLEARYLAFVAHALGRSTGRFRNFMSFSRRFAEEVGSEDCHGRALWALGAVVLRGARPGSRRLARDLFLAALPATDAFTSPRGWAYTLLGLDAYLSAIEAEPAALAARRTLARRLFELLERTGTLEWPWFEDRLTYANARLPHALLVSGLALEDEAMSASALRALSWLAARQDVDGTFSPIGAPGFHVRGGPRASFDQQPLEACGMVSASLAAGRATGDPRWGVTARSALAWFVGQNVLHQSLYDETTGACRDGLHEDRPNENRGAESTLSFLLALAEMRGAS